MTYLFKLARRTACQRALPLIAFTAVMMTLAISRFRKRLD